MARTTIRTEDVTDSEVTTAKMAVDPTNASNLASGSVPTAQLGNVPPNTGLQNDIATLALHSAIADNKAAFNLTNAFIDQYEDDSGIDTETDVVRNTSGEYMSSISGTAEDSNTVFLCHCDGVNDGTTFTDVATGGSAPHTITAVADAHTDTSEKKFGTASLQCDGTGDYISMSPNGDFVFGTDPYTIDLWAKMSDNQSAFYTFWSNGTGSGAGEGVWWGGYATGNYWAVSDDFTNSWEWTFGETLPSSAESWRHYAWTRDGSTQRFYIDGVQKQTATATNLSANGTAKFGDGYGSFYGYLDEIRISKTCRYPDGTTFSVPTDPYGLITSATGNYTSTTQTANATVSKMGIVVLYKNAYGSATLDTDLVAQVSANGGTNYTSAPLTAAGTFSTGILAAKSNDITISNTGTTPKYKISFANQAAASKETQVYGVALIY